MSVTTNAVTKRYYPALSEVLNVDGLPNFLDFAEDGLDLLLNVQYGGIFSTAIFVKEFSHS